MYLAIKYQYTLYTLDASNSISFKTFLPKKKKVFCIDIIGEYTVFYKYQKNNHFKRFHRYKVQFLSVFMFQDSEILNFCYKVLDAIS